MRTTEIFQFKGETVGQITQSKTQRPRNIMLIGWDGVQRNHLRDSMGRGELPENPRREINKFCFGLQEFLKRVRK